MSSIFLKPPRPLDEKEAVLPIEWPGCCGAVMSCPSSLLLSDRAKDPWSSLPLTAYILCPCALALERMHGHPELGEQVAGLDGVDQARAATMVQQGLRSIQWADMHHFMRLAGVFRERVSCRASKDGRTQLDALNDRCWRAIRCYLKLRDIRDPTAASLPPQ
ncbi:hypothetical protein HPB48_026752 [Haemaphysalis longicornis]|uniref:Uncharacterized protein n=1 Tax=Haemaphysalis longicornis TaxID=44386 RepID=A0A9J6HAJ0_HAELO|nr:hypothetical protein HPB48_026752 [Haemaphysalis longicornis]